MSEEVNPPEEGGQGLVVRCSPQLNGEQRRFLRALGHHLQPVVQIGDKGLHEAVLKQIRHALLAHELVKVRWRGAEPEERKEGAQRLHKELTAQVVQMLGHTLLIYKEHPEKPKIQLPRKRKKKSRSRHDH